MPGSSLNHLNKRRLEGVKLIVFDVDGILVPRGTKIRRRGNKTIFYIKKIKKKLINLIEKMYRIGFMVNVNSGRSLEVLQRMFWPVLDYLSLTYENGSATWYRGKIYQHVNSYVKLKELYLELSKIKSKKIKGFEPKEFIISLHCTEKVKRVENVVKKHKRVYFIWNGEAYDIGLKNKQTKLNGLREFAKVLKLKMDNVMFIGDNYNDSIIANKVKLVVSADKKRLKGNYYVKLSKKELPAEVLMKRLTSLFEK